MKRHRPMREPIHPGETRRSPGCPPGRRHGSARGGLTAGCPRVTTITREVLCQFLVLCMQSAGDRHGVCYEQDGDSRG